MPRGKLGFLYGKRLSNHLTGVIKATNEFSSIEGEGEHKLLDWDHQEAVWTYILLQQFKLVPRDKNVPTLLQKPFKTLRKQTDLGRNFPIRPLGEQWAQLLHYDVPIWSKEWRGEEKMMKGTLRSFQVVFQMRGDKGSCFWRWGGGLLNVESSWARREVKH